MPKHAEVVLFSALIVSSLAMVHAQDNPTAANLENLKTVIVATETKSDSVIAVPPVTFVTVNLRSGKKAAGSDAVDLPNWLNKEAALNGLQSTDIRPWHIVVTYDQFDEDGDNVHSGVYEEFWVGAKKYKRIYKSDNFNQTDYASDKDLYRHGDQQWPDHAQAQVRAEVIAPFSYAATLQGFHGRNVERSFSGYTLQCVLIERDSEISTPTQYCFEPQSSVLRYNSGFGWFQTVYNRIVPFQGRNLAREVDVTDGGKPYLKLRVETVELLSHVDDVDFLPPSDAVGPLGDRVSGVSPQPVDMSRLPQWPTSLRAQHFTVKVDIVIGKDGRVISAHGISGPLEGYKACEDSVRKWVFKPYLVLDQPVEVEAKVECSNN
ncbi:MAG TPA: hypothetical protein VFB10_01710 [Candidatus Dormibacteraeota bacterium]|nr:hypothetical protein [Verrucomicrobiae bacterium]HYW65395.1 hypothetical protein [Candidatus Dormibacteraeota bacterium]